jgi:molybdopterin-guanine dinucleotide biosynthesis protein A
MEMFEIAQMFKQPEIPVNHRAPGSGAESQCYHFCVDRAGRADRAADVDGAGPEDRTERVDRALHISRAGYVLAGGRSSRMGRDKALLPFRGGLLGEMVARAVAEAAGSAVLVGNTALGEKLGFPAIPDLYPGEGPLAGILAALAHTTADWNLIVACDMPGLTAGFLGGLLDGAERAGAAVLLPAGPAGRPEPLCAVYRRRSRAPIEAAFQRGVRKVAAALEEAGALTLPVPDIAPFQNVNTPEDWAGYAAE